MKFLNSICGIFTAFLLLGQSVMLPSSAADTEYRKLNDYPIYNGGNNLNWCGGDFLEVNNARVPIDSTVTCEGTPSLRIHTTDRSDSWSVRIVVRSWMSMDFSQYLSDGRLEFDVKGEAGNEQFQIALSDYEEDTAAVSAGAYTSLTQNWQHVSIPLCDLAAVNSEVNFDDITLLYLQNDGTTDAQQFWITNIEITSEGLEAESPPIKVNQEGFSPHSEKYAMVSMYPELCNLKDGSPFIVHNQHTGESVYEGTLSLVSEFDRRDSGEMVFRADFSELTECGEYYLSVDGLEDSVTFAIKEHIYEEALTAAQKYFYFQRQGISLDKTYAGEFARDNLGIDDSNVAFESGNSTLSSEKGWFDAGDSGKYVNTGSGTVSSLLWAYSMYPEQFPDGSLNIPESGNGIPDILDEARWELEWILTMQDQKSGGFYPRIQGDAGKRKVMDLNGCTTDDTACATAVLAESYLVYQNIDPDFAEKCLAAAEKGWGYLEAHPENIISYDVYEVSDDTYDRLWAAAALYRASGSNSCETYFLNNYQYCKSQFEDNYAYANGWGNNWLTGYWHYLLCEKQDAAVVAWVKEEVAVWRNTLLTVKWENNIWGLPLHQGNYFRGITMEICSMSMALSVTDSILEWNDERTEQCAETSLSWILGANPLGISYLSGIGENSICTIHSEIYEKDGIEEIPDGYMPQGPNYTALKLYSKFAAKCYLDNQNDWVSNEHTIYANADLVFLLASVADSEIVEGDVNMDGIFSVADVVMLQKWILHVGNLTNWQAGDLCRDGEIDISDLLVMKCNFYK